MSTEATAQILIRIRRHKAGWSFLDGERGTANVSLEMQIKVENKSRFP